jgi:mannosyltransferase
VPHPLRRTPLARISTTATAAIAVGLVCVAVQAIGSWGPSLWGDEAASLLSAERSLPSLLRMVQHVDAVHGTYYLFLHGWIQLFGTSPFAIRFPSAIAAGTCAAAVVVIGARMRSLPVGIAAGVICTVLPRMTYIGEEARSYAFSAAIAAWLTLLLILALSRHGRVRGLWIAYGVLLAVGVYVFLYTALVAVAHGVVLLLAARRRRVLVPWLIAAGSAALAASPLLVLAFLERGQIAYLADRTEVSPTAVLVTIWFGEVPFAIVGWALTVAGLVIAALPWLRRRGAPRHPIELLVLAWFLLPSVLLIGTSPIVAGFTARYLALCTPAVALLMAVPLGMLAARWRPALAIGTAVVVAAGAGPWVAQRGPYAMNDSDWAEISADVARVIQPGDAVVFDESVRPSRRPRLALRTYPVPVAWRDPTRGTPFRENSTWHDGTITVPRAAARGRFDGVDRVWMIEYAIGGRADTADIADLEHLGFHRGRELSTHRSRIIEFIRAAS